MKLKTILTALFLSLSLMSIAHASISDASDAYQKGDYEKAFQIITPLAEQGGSVEQAMLAELYRKGKGVPQDYKQAAKWYRKAADQGDVDAQYSLALMYTQGKGVLKDYKEAVKWYRKAADQGYAEAQALLGDLKDIKNYQIEISFFDKDSGFYFPEKIADFSYTDKKKYGPKELGYSLRYRGEQQGRIDVYVYNLGFEDIQNGTDGPLILKNHMQAYDDVQSQVRNGIYTSFLDIKGVNKFPSDFLNNNFSYIDTRVGQGRQISYLFSRGQNKYFVKVRASVFESEEKLKLFEDKLNKFLKKLLLVLNKEYEG
jgi:hypothetical protein